VLDLLAGRHGARVPPDFVARVDAVTDPLADADLQLALACCYELSFVGFDGCDVDDWDADLLSMRRPLESAFEDALLGAVPAVTEDLLRLPVHEALRELVDGADGPSMSAYVLREATHVQVQELLAQKSIYQLREADPHTLVVPRLRGPAKAALVEIQTDEYGGGRWPAMHSTLFAQAMRGVGLDDTYGAYWDLALPETFAALNLMSLLALHRRWRGAIVGHLAVLEMTSTGPMRRYANGLRRLRYGDAVTAYFDEHVEADAVHEQIAAVDLCGAFVRAEPTLRRDLLWGASACLSLEQAMASALLDRWTAPDEIAVSA
jgi:hypothetical protein